MIRPVSRALISVSDKRDLLPFASRLVAAGVEIVSSGGTAQALTGADIPVTTVTEATGSPEILGGRVKTLHPRIHGGILARADDEGDAADLAAQGIEPFQLVVVNLYPFEATVTDPGGSPAEAIEQIDIGGPAMIRAAAKNHDAVGVVTSPNQYEEVGVAIEAGGLSDELRERLATAAFLRTAAYDAAIHRWMQGDEDLPGHLLTRLDRVDTLRYGENPHQEAALYVEHGSSPWWRTARLLQGKAMSFNNYADAEAVWRLAGDLPRPAAVIVKHTNPCGVAMAPTLEEAFAKAWECDPLSAFGGVIAVNTALDEVTAKRVTANFVEVVVAPGVDDQAEAILAEKASLRVLVAPPPDPGDVDMRRIERGMLLQRRDTVDVDAGSGFPEGWTVVAGEVADDRQLEDLVMAWVVAAHTKSNAIVVVKDGAAVGVGAGDQSRVGAAERALVRASERARGAVAASDAFLPFRDGLDALADAGVTALVQPGGSKRDPEVIAAAAERGVTLVNTGIRHFRH